MSRRPSVDRLCAKNNGLHLVGVFFIPKLESQFAEFLQ